MLCEAELFVMAEQMLVEVHGRVRAEHVGIVVPPLSDQPGDLLGDDPAHNLTLLAEAACVAARAATDGDAVVHSGAGDISTREFLWGQTIARCFLAHEVAMQLGSRACPLPEDLARGIWEGAHADAPAWRSRGVFREPLPSPADASWRDRFLALAGRDPHPFLD